MCAAQERFRAGEATFPFPATPILEDLADLYLSCAVLFRPKHLLSVRVWSCVHTQDVFLRHKISKKLKVLRVLRFFQAFFSPKALRRLFQGNPRGQPGIEWGPKSKS